MNSLILCWSVDTTCFFELIELLFLFFSWCVRGEYLYLQCYTHVGVALLYNYKVVGNTNKQVGSAFTPIIVRIYGQFLVQRCL